MGKLGRLIIIIGLVIMAYLMLMVLQPFTNVAIQTANASANWSNFPGGQEAIVGYPFWVYLIPFLIGMLAVVGILRSKDV